MADYHRPPIAYFGSSGWDTTASPTDDSDHPAAAAQIAKTATAVTLGGGLLVLSAVTLTATVVGLIVATPLLVIFSPVLVPAALATLLVAAGFLASGGFGVAALAVMTWMYRYVTGGHPVGADQLDHARNKISGKARDWRDHADLPFTGHRTAA